MSIERMNMLNMIGHIDELDKASKLVVLSSSVHLVSAMEEIDTTKLSSDTNGNSTEVLDDSYIQPYTYEKDSTSMVRDIKKLKEMCMVNCQYEPKEKDLIFHQEQLQEEIKKLKNEFSSLYDVLMDKKSKRKYILENIERVKYLSSINISLLELDGLKNFSFEIHKVAKEKILRLKENYENIPSIVISLFKAPEYEIVITLTPILLKAESDKIFKSLNSETINIPDEYKGKPKVIVKALKNNLITVEEEIADLTKKLQELSLEKGQYLIKLEKSVELELKAQQVKNSMARTNQFFYLGGWIPEGNFNGVNEALGEYNERLIMVERSTEELDSDIVPPTKLKNNFILRPFEAMVNMYGVPSYKEADPTAFFGISYMLLFGAMFGDLGQGLVLLLAGIYLKYKKYRTNLGPVLVRLGISSSIFGLIYGSFFGFEDVIPALVIRPMEDITKILLYAIVFGCCLSVIGFIYSMINNFKKKNLEDGAFGKNGAAGFIFYLSILTFVTLKFLKLNIIPQGVWISLFVIPLIITLFKQPLANLIQNKKPFHSEEKGEYYMEGTFGLLEFILGIFSNTVSFVRVGAFALNHVGLFLAFASLAEMTHNKAGGALMYILGNLIILGIEGLVVFIQGMRLEYYELFGRYYEGEGIAFEPVRLTTSFKFKKIKLIEKIKSFNNRG